jgi:hypothetical protein
MKQYVVDELRPADYEKIKTYLDTHLGDAALGGVYRIPLADQVLSDVQRYHEECRPHYVALELDNNRMVCEFLVRSPKRIRCDCIAYATEAQRNWLIDVVDAMLEAVGITI